MCLKPLEANECKRFTFGTFTVENELQHLNASMVTHQLLNFSQAPHNF